MSALTVTAKGQLTLRREVLRHLGVKPGDKLELELLPEGKGLLRSARPAASMDEFVGKLAGKSRKAATLEEINRAATQGWAGRR